MRHSPLTPITNASSTAYCNDEEPQHPRSYTTPHTVPCPPQPMLPLLPATPPIMCTPERTLAAAGICLVWIVTWRRTTGLANEPREFVRGSCKRTKGVRSRLRNGLECGGRACERHMGGHVNADAGCTNVDAVVRM